MLESVAVDSAASFFKSSIAMTNYSALQDDNSDSKFFKKGFIPATAIGIAVLVGAQHVGERMCPAHDICQIEPTKLPDEPTQKDPANPLGSLRITATAPSTITPTNTVTPTNSK
jgi:hypothetical protein